MTLNYRNFRCEVGGHTDGPRAADLASDLRQEYTRIYYNLYQE